MKTVMKIQGLSDRIKYTYILTCLL